MKIQKFLFLLVFFLMQFSFSCKDGNTTTSPKKEEPPVEDMSGFAKGADVSWLTEMENTGVLFYDSEGNETECMGLLKSLGMNSIRLRVWVNPADGWCNKSDFLIKAKRANDLNMRVMVDFHYSDSWADPAQQTKPAAWADLSFTDLCQAVTDHTTDVLSSLQEWGITPEWVQIGNETGNGMLWDDGKASESMANYAALTNCGYDAIKAIFPDAIAIVHIQNGHRIDKFNYIFNGLKNNGGKWDAIGMSLYPEADTWQSMNDDIIANIKTLITQYNTDVVVCEVGMSWDEADVAYTWLSDLITRSKAIDRCLGVFYWEPQSYNGWKLYQKGAFDDTGAPTKALNAFGD